MSLSVVMPAYNECQTIATIVERVLATELVDEIIVIDDGSSDGTSQVLENLGQREITGYHGACGVQHL